MCIEPETPPFEKVKGVFNYRLPAFQSHLDCGRGAERKKNKTPMKSNHSYFGTAINYWDNNNGICPKSASSSIKHSAAPHGKKDEGAGGVRLRRSEEEQSIVHSRS